MSTEVERKLSATAERFCRRFSVAEIKSATGDFNEQHVIGEGGFGKVYKGIINGVQQTVAMKRLAVWNPDQGEAEFLREIETLCDVRHMNVVSLIGYCNEDGEMILVYEYIPRRTLADHLYRGSRDEDCTREQRLNICIGAARGEGVNGSNPVPALSWAQRVQIAMAAAKGLEYIHEKSQIHCNIKSSNILVFDDYQVAKIADFGWSAESTYDRESSSKTDVYSFGVVLLQLLTGDKVIDDTRPNGEQHLVHWARPQLIGERRVKKVVDARLKGDYPPKDAVKMAAIAAQCVQYDHKLRPSMKLVVRDLRPLLN